MMMSLLRMILLPHPHIGVTVHIAMARLSVGTNSCDMHLLIWIGRCLTMVRLILLLNRRTGAGDDLRPDAPMLPEPPDLTYHELPMKRLQQLLEWGKTPLYHGKDKSGSDDSEFDVL